MEHDHFERTDGCGSRLKQTPQPFFVNVPSAAQDNCLLRTALWTGSCLQMSLMHIPPRGELSSEILSETDQLLRVEMGCALVRLGAARDCLNRHLRLCEDDAVFIPCGTWHHVINVGNSSLKLSSMCAPPCRAGELP